MKILEGNEDGRITTTDGDVVLNLHPLVLRLADRIGVSAEVPPDAGKITLIQSEKLEDAQSTVQFIKFFSVFMAILVLALFVLAIYLAGGFRREALRVLALGLIVVGLLVLAARRIAGDVIVGDLTSPTTYDVGNAVWLIGTSLLQGIAFAVIGYGLVLLLGVWFAGDTRLAVWCRRRVAPVVRDARVGGLGRRGRACSCCCWCGTRSTRPTSSGASSASPPRSRSASRRCGARCPRVGSPRPPEPRARRGPGASSGAPRRGRSGSPCCRSSCRGCSSCARPRGTGCSTSRDTGTSPRG